MDVEKTDEDFIRQWSERAYDKAQLAQIQAIEDHLIEYAMHGWRPISIPPHVDALLIGVCEEGLVLMVVNSKGEWRTSLGQPHKPPRAWMLAPVPPKPNGRGL